VYAKSAGAYRVLGAERDRVDCVRGVDVGGRAAVEVVDVRIHELHALARRNVEVARPCVCDDVLLHALVCCENR
jgi:hypothetical protein